MPIEFKFTFNTPAEMDGWLAHLKQVGFGALVPKITSAPDGSLVVATPGSDAEELLTSKGTPVGRATAIELITDLRDAGWGPSLVGLSPAELRKLFTAYKTGDKEVLAAYPKAQEEKEDKESAPPRPKGKKAPEPEPEVEEPEPPKPPKRGKAGPVPMPPSKSGPVPTRRGKPAPSVEEDVEEVANVVQRAPLPKKRGTAASPSNASKMNRHTPDSIPGALDEDYGEDEEVELVDDEEGEVEVLEEDEVEVFDEDGEEEIEEEAPPVHLPKITKNKIPPELLSADRMRNIIALIQRIHKVSKPADIHRYMLAYAPHVPKIQQHLDAEGNEERMVNRIGNIVAAMTPGS